MWKTSYLFFITVLCFNLSCNKYSDLESDAFPFNTKLSYGDSIFYLSNNVDGNLIFPNQNRVGKYTAFPEGISLNENTGVIDLSKSETGLYYEITYRSKTGTTSATQVLLSGINYVDAYFKLAENDYILRPVYNAKEPVSFNLGSFDVDGSAEAAGCVIDKRTGAINLSETVNNHFFGTTYGNGLTREVEIKYRLNDKSKNALQSIKLLLYYYRTMEDVPEALKQKVDDHLKQILNTARAIQGDQLPSGITFTKPRPPCIVIIGH